MTSISDTNVINTSIKQTHSRLINSRTKEPDDTVFMSVFIESEVHSLFLDSIRKLPVTFEEALNATKQDQLLRQVIKYHRTQWPANLSGDLQQFHRRRNSLYTINDCILFYERVVVPQKLQPMALRQFSIGNLGINRIRALARSYVNWPYMD
ncbi:unnamed protein product [Schistocephalus solidus]|uniref:Integrase_H2C2 domain-containing protein n=1 Tax=Schistocephalus solidus TaxID=70667 RepID=A0A183SRB9_SCHSO|nr:unnamed protein product [Schistocephalus solidus]